MTGFYGSKIAPRNRKSQSSLELLITLSFGLVILLPVVVLAFLQISTSTSTLATTEASQAATKLAATATIVGSQGPPAKEVVTIQVPPDTTAVYVGTLAGSVGHLITFNVSTNAGPSLVTAYTPVNVSGSLGGITATATYLINITDDAACPSNSGISCVYIQQQ